MKRLSLAFLAASLVLFSCKKDSEQDDNPNKPAPNSFSELQVSANFDWSTTANFEIAVKGQENLSYNPQRLLSVRDEAGNVVFRKWVRMSDDHNLKFTAASANRSMEVEFGSIKKEVSFSAYRAQFDYSMPIDNSDLDPSDR